MVQRLTVRPNPGNRGRLLSPAEKLLKGGYCLKMSCPAVRLTLAEIAAYR